MTELALKATAEGNDFEQFLNVLQDESVRVANKTNTRWAYRIRDEVVSAIESQSKPLTRLSPGYKKSKIRKGLDPRILIATKKYLKAIKVWKYGQGGQMVLHVGVHPAATYTRRTAEGKKTQIRVTEVARMLEHGTVNMPPPPVWSFVIDDLTFDLKTFNKWFFKEAKKRINKKTSGKKKKRKVA